MALVERLRYVGPLHGVEIAGVGVVLRAPTPDELAAGAVGPEFDVAGSVAGRAPGPWTASGPWADDGRLYRQEPDGSWSARDPGAGLLAQDTFVRVDPPVKGK